MKQTALALSLSQRTVLVTMETVRAALGLDAETITQRVDSGELRWVFDVSAVTAACAERNGRRELRFWSKEIVAPEFCRGVTPDQAADQIVGVATREWLRSGEVAHLLLVSDPHVGRLWQRGFLSGEITGRSLKLRRASLITWLQSRLIA